MGVRPSYFDMFNIRVQEFFSLKKFQNFKNLTVKFLKFNKRNGQKNENSIQLITYQFDTVNIISIQ